MSAQLNHDQAFELLPWFLNGTLSGRELDSVESHVRDCLTCRLAVREQHRLHAAIQAQPTVPLSAEQGFDRLLRDMDRTRAAPTAHRARRFFGFAFAPSGARVSIAAAGLAAVGMLGWLTVTGGIDRDVPGFATLARKATIDVGRLDLIFAKSVTEADMRVLLNEIGGTIVGGPSDLGRYTIRLNATNVTAAEVDALIERLGRDQRIRFAGRSLIEEEAK